MRNHRGSLAFIVAVLTILLATSASAGPPTDQIKQRVDDVLRVVTDPALRDKPAERHAEVRKIAENIFDYQDTARRALGPHWNSRTPQEREEFLKLFADLLDRAYVSKIELYHGEKVRYTGESIDGDEATVKTNVVTNKGSEIPIDYRLHLKGDRWLVYDVVIEGVSLVANYRSQFNTIIQTQSYQALVDKLRAKEAEGSASPAGRRR